MFFLSRLLDFLTTPIIWVFVLFLYGLITHIPSRKKIFLITTFVLLYLFSNTFLLNECMRAWETSGVRKGAIKEPYDYGIVLGGMITYDSETDKIQFVRSVNRVMQALELYKEGKIKKIVISSGAGSLKNRNTSEAAIIKKYIEKLGIPTQDIIAENASRNTYENAVFTNKLLGNKKSRNLLITSSYHMRRSLACFKKTGLVVDSFVVDRYAVSRKFYPDVLFLPSAKALEGWNVLLHEIMGFVVYRVMGYC
ncbi:MAG: hypothetical protein A2275_11800 [Bacteroidetes bacterium RIFOXYA12_FULL_35_11]|nr:MAG: hypothetical protein A2X01_17635 [Bacteroidetes bacterium GWF2_35_48]OFY83006.1 MAG: hypothetical protein A2275_11800 [Bacteroidetes bacterium RIFOXYA12_FULL_35_11]OFY95084.1 MAG: hypothetical protein A2309_03620 [Bacteroidetes bacterium RIFOXYB2_FULL_35_7]OFY95520.1 MAG: hypothetical protein A2491_05645 [Bacteroidetes bacterium RIFOXYC12_FULL_35_7]HBX53601.1 hypothetical protein [Bacteroidales bacterium]